MKFGSEDGTISAADERRRFRQQLICAALSSLDNDCHPKGAPLVIAQADEILRLLDAEERGK